MKWWLTHSPGYKTFPVNVKNTWNANEFVHIFVIIIEFSAVQRASFVKTGPIEGSFKWVRFRLVILARFMVLRLFFRRGTLQTNLESTSTQQFDLGFMNSNEYIEN